jgi:hypothetical protein
LPLCRHQIAANGDPLALFNHHREDSEAIPTGAVVGIGNARSRLLCRGEHNVDFPTDFAFGKLEIMLYSGHTKTRKSLGLMTRKLSVTESQKSDQRFGTLSRRNDRTASANA